MMLASLLWIVPLLVHQICAQTSSGTTTSFTSQTTTATSCGDYYTITVNNSAEASSLGSACPTITGSLTLATSISGDIDLYGIETIEGDFYVADVPGLTSLSAFSLDTVEGYFSLINLPHLNDTDLDIYNMSYVNMTGLPLLQYPPWYSPYGIYSLWIQDTNISSITSLSMDYAEQIWIADNANMESIEIWVQNITYLGFENNSPNTAVTINDLTWFQNATFQNLTSLSLPDLQYVNDTFWMGGNFFNGTVSFPNLVSVGGDLVVYGHHKLETISMKSLTKVGGDLQIIDNTALTAVDAISINSLTSIGGGLQITGNDKIQEVSGLQSLKTVSDNIDIEGAFTSVVLPSIADVKDGFTLNTTGTFDCTAFNAAYKSNILKGDYKCVGSNTTTTHQSTTSAGSKPTGTGTGGGGGNGGSSLSTGAKAGIGIGVAVPALAIISFLGFFFRRRQSRQKDVQQQNGPPAPPPAEMESQQRPPSELMGGGSNQVSPIPERRSLIHEQQKDVEPERYELVGSN